MSKRILITGISGFTGHYVARELINMGCEVFGLSHSARINIDGVKQIFSVSLTDAIGLTNVVAKIQPHYVIHLAAISFVAHSDIREMYETNVIGTRNLLEALKSLMVLPESVIVASSANVYGNNDSGIPLTEQTLLSPVNDYAVTKVSSEFVAALYGDIYPITIVRPFNYTGQLQAAQFLVPKIVNAAKSKQSIIELGNLDVARDFSDVRDIARFYRELIQRPDVNHLRTINLCSGKSHTLQEILEYSQQAANHYFDEVRVNPAFVRSNEIKLLLGDTELLNKSIQNQSRFTLQDTINWMIDGAVKCR